MATLDVISATIRAKVLAKHERFEYCKHDYKLVILIQEMSYVTKDANSGELRKGIVKADDFVHKTNLYYYDYLHGFQIMRTKFYNLTRGDIINFSIQKKGREYEFLSLEIEDETPCYNNDLTSLVEQYGQNIDN